MKIITNKEKHDMIISLEGKLTSIDAPKLQNVIENELLATTHLVFDLKKLEHISSAGLRVLLSAQKIMNKKGSMVICNANDSIMQIFEMTGFSKLFNIK